MMFLGVVVFCASIDFTTCQITSREDLFDNLTDCQDEVVSIVNATHQNGFIARGYCAPVKTGMQT